MYFIFETIYNGKKSGGVCVSKTLAGARIKAMMVHKDNFGTLPCPVDVFVAKITKKEYMNITNKGEYLWNYWQNNNDIESIRNAEKTLRNEIEIGLRRRFKDFCEYQLLCNKLGIENKLNIE